MVNNTTSSDGTFYHDYTDMVGDVQAGTILSVDVRYSFSHYLAIYVDWNNNLSFDDAGETIVPVNTSSIPSGIHTVTYYVPATTAVGQYRMRVVASDGQAKVSSCPTGVSYTEAEDYTLNVLPPPACVQPSLSIPEITENSALLMWNAASAGAFGYEIVLVQYTDTLVVSFTSDTTFLLTGLSPLTTYNIGIRTRCTEEQYSEWTNSSFTTACSAYSLPYFDDFSSWTTGGGNWSNACWTKYTGALAYNANYPYITTSQNTSINTSMYFNHSSTTVSAAFLPLLAANVDALKVEFDLYMSSSIRMDVVIATDPQDADTWDVIQTIDDGNSTMKHYAVYLNNYAGTGTYIGFKSHTGSTMLSPVYLDNVFVEFVPSCIPPSNITVSADTVITLSWTPGANETVWTVEWSLNNDFSAATILNVSGTPDTVIITNLVFNTTYYIRVKANCGDSDESIWTSTSYYHGYCIPAPISSDGLTNVSFADVNNTTPKGTNGGAPYYNNYSATQIGTVQAGTLLDFSVTYNYGFRLAIYV
ncbi:MAG: fibronectin type III domain-containing protein, partial [Bacteroidales bacterium]|nr:fibronectin type III domain-containing protein [Bacteroidales bacterium]